LSSLSRRLPPLALVTASRRKDQRRFRYAGCGITTQVFCRGREASLWRWLGAATKNWVELKSAVERTRCLEFRQGVFGWNQPLCPKRTCMVELKDRFGREHGRRSRRFSGEIPTPEHTRPLALSGRKTPGSFF